MTTALADTNLFLRYLVSGHEHHSRAAAIFQRVQKKQLHLLWSSVIFVEVIHVLKSPKLYQLGRSEIAALLEPLFRLNGLKVEDRSVAERALDIFVSSKLDIADAWVAAKAQLGKVKAVYTFDDDFKNIPGVERLSP